MGVVFSLKATESHTTSPQFRALAQKLLRAVVSSNSFQEVFISFEVLKVERII